MRPLAVTLKVGLIAGIDISDACRDLCELANHIGCLIEANFNGIILLAHTGGNPLELEEAYKREIRSKHNVKIATS